jgi:hypothetical protein
VSSAYGGESHEPMSDISSVLFLEIHYNRPIFVPDLMASEVSMMSAAMDWEAERQLVLPILPDCP